MTNAFATGVMTVATAREKARDSGRLSVCMIEGAQRTGKGVHTAGLRLVTESIGKRFSKSNIMIQNRKISVSSESLYLYIQFN